MGYIFTTFDRQRAITEVAATLMTADRQTIVKWLIELLGPTATDAELRDLVEFSRLLTGPQYQKNQEEA